jgi:Trypsin
MVVGAVVLAWAAGCGSAAGPSRSGDESVARSGTPIQGGTVDTAHDFAVGVVQLMPNGDVAFCSGVLLAPNLVATARHCVSTLASAEIDCATSTFTRTLPASDMFVTESANISSASQRDFIPVIGGDGGADGVIVPAAPSVCGNDLALLILSRSIVLPQYVTPTINPPMTDHQAYTTAITAIGYGVDTPTDTMGATAGVRRIKENIDIVCIPNDATPANCFSDPTARQFISASEFEGGDGTCEGDSGSGAYDQGSFDVGNWVAFGVLSRGGVSPEGGTCEGSIYSRFDAWGSLIIGAANRAAAVGGYDAPSWAGTAAQPSADGAPASTAGAAACLVNGTSCTLDSDCCGVNCISHDNNRTAFCTACDGNDPCNTGFGCEQGICILGATTPVDAGPAGAAATGATHGGGGGCAVGSPGAVGSPRTEGQTAAVAMAALALALGRGAWRKRRKAPQMARPQEPRNRARTRIPRA